MLAGFFTYMFGYAFYQNWVHWEKNMRTKFAANEDMPDGAWPLT